MEFNQEEDSANAYCCHFCPLTHHKGVFGVDADEVMSVSVMEGESVTLHTNLTDIQRRDQILWIFGPQETRVAEIHTQSVYMYNSNKIFGDRLQLDSQTGSLTITNITSTDSGLYQLQIINSSGTLYKTFNVTVYARLPAPDVSTNSSKCSPSSGKCVLLCSMMNVAHVSLSWHKGNSLLSSISVSDLNIRLSLPLEVEYHDTNTYRCVVSNPVSNQTQHLHIYELCQLCSDPSQHYLIPLIAVLVLVLLVIVFVIYCHNNNCKQQTIKFRQR